LFYNDYSIASDSGWTKTKSDKVYNWIAGLKAKGVPIDGIGFQLHIDVAYQESMFPGIISNIRRFAALGLEVHFTEIDVACSPYGTKCAGWTPTQASTQARVYSQLLKICMQESACKSFETWGFTDAHTWLGESEHPLPWDQNYAPKPAANAIINVLTNKTVV